MNSTGELTNHRSDPGIIIFNSKKQVTYINPIMHSTFLSFVQEHNPANSKTHFKIPVEILEFCDELKGRQTCFAWNACQDAVYLKKCVIIRKTYFILRGFIISSKQKRSTSTNFLILLEKLAVRANVGLAQACTHYKLSSREAQIIRTLVMGLTNKEIASHLHITEATVKEHIRNIMRKVNATTRTGVLSKIFMTSDETMWGSEGNALNSLPLADYTDTDVSSTKKLSTLKSF